MNYVSGRLFVRVIFNNRGADWSAKRERPLPVALILTNDSLDTVVKADPKTPRQAYQM